MFIFNIFFKFFIFLLNIYFEIWQLLFLFVTDIDWSNPYDCQMIPGIRSLHQVMATRNHKPPIIKVREKTCFCDDYIKDNLVSVCENIVNGYVSHWNLNSIVKKPPFEDANIDTGIHDPIYSANYEHVSNLVIIDLCIYVYMYVH